VIDPQREYVDGLLRLEGIDEAIIEVRRLLELARERNVPIFHVVHHGRQGSAVFDPDGPAVAIIAELAPRDDETIITKALPNAFAATSLHELLRRAGRTELIVTGFATHMCVSATTRAALDLGYRVTLVANGTATRALPNPLSGETIPARIIHEATLAALADRFAIVVADSAALATGP
jgi:nicotinamidase-related amidase